MTKLTELDWLNHTLWSVIIIVVAFLFYRILRFFLRRFLLKSSKRLNVDPTNYTFLNNGLGLVTLIITITIILYSIPQFKQIGVTLFAGAGIFAAIVGFASQTAFSNIISGIFIVIFKPFRVGDIVQSEKYVGTIEDITLRHVVIKDFENRRYIVPNSLISNDVIHNSSIYEDKTGTFVTMSISYDADLDKAIDILREEAMAHPLLIDNRTDEEKSAGDPIVPIRVRNLNDSSVDLRATCWANTYIEGFEIKTDLYRSVKLRFDKEGIEIPFPHRTIVMKKDGKVS